MFRMAAVVRKYRPSVVEAHNVNTLPAAFLGAKSIGASLVYDAHEINTGRESYYARIRWLVWLVERLTVPRARLVMSTTSMRAQHYLDTYRLKEMPLVIQNRPPYSEMPRNHRLRDELQIPEDKVIVLYQGGLQEGRGLHNIVRISARVRNAVFVFLGNGAQEGSLRDFVQTLGVQDRVRFHPAVPLVELPEYTASADIGMQILRNTCLNHYTTDSNKVFEYAMGGLAVVASDFPEIRRIVENFKYGVLVDPDDVEKMSAVLQKLVDDDEQRRKLQENALASRRALSWESQEEVFLEAIERVVREDA